MDGISRDNSALVVIDVQEKFRPVIKDFDDTVANIVKLIKGFQVLGVPIIFTQQYTKGLGETVDEIKKVAEFEPIEKLSFSCFDEDEFKRKIRALGRRHLVLCGIESHVCLLNTALDAIEAGYTIHYVIDAVSSRRESDKDIAVKRVIQEGAKAGSTEIVLFQILKTADAGEFKEISKIVK
ncbi:MAG TPA: hydrolase [Candidatus Altiarchaeales archaeon]|nr:hydrolase [Candidatus Altiarchaeales archaeon]